MSVQERCQHVLLVSMVIDSSHHRFISLGLYGLINTLIARNLKTSALVLFVLQYVGYAFYVFFRGVPSPVSLALGIAKTPSLVNLFALGLVAGTLSFGGAYTALPFIQVEAVLKGAWLPQSVFLDSIAIGNVLPAPLVIFATFVGFQGGLVDGGVGNAFAGAVLITFGMFFPCFVFTIAGHRVLEKLVQNKVGPGFAPFSISPLPLLLPPSSTKHPHTTSIQSQYPTTKSPTLAPLLLLRWPLRRRNWCHRHHRSAAPQIQRRRIPP